MENIAKIFFSRVEKQIILNKISMPYWSFMILNMNENINKYIVSEFENRTKSHLLQNNFHLTATNDCNSDYNRTDSYFKITIKNELCDGSGRFSAIINITFFKC